MKEPTALQIKEFWKKLGWEEIEPIYLYGGERANWSWTGVLNTNTTHILNEELPPIDLNNLFQYAVPKYIDEKCFELHIDDIEAFDYLCAEWQKQILAAAGSLGKRAYKLHYAVSLFWAIYKEIKEGKC